MEKSKRTIAAVATAAGLISLLVFLRAITCGFLNYDDPDFVQYNPAIKNLDADLLSYAFASIPSFSGIWTPLVWLSFALDYRLWELNPLGYHLTNIVLHAANTSLVVLIADRLYQRAGDRGQGAGGRSEYLYPATLLLAGLLWGLHPLRVESVAWISERKDVLNGIFSLGSLLMYLRYAQRRDAAGEQGGARSGYLISLLLFMISLLAKPVSVVMPLLFLVLDWYPLNRIRRDTVRAVLIEKVPYLAVMTAMIALTLYRGAAEGGLLISAESFSFGQRLVTSGNAVFEYMRLMLYPVEILPIHLLATPIPFSHKVKTAVVILICIFFCITRKRSWPFATWLCFIIPLVPVLAFFQTNNVALAARYTYLPSVIPAIVGSALLVALYTTVTARVTKRYIRAGVACLLLAPVVCYSVMTYRLINVWKDSETFWTRQITYQPFDKAYFLRGVSYVSAGNYLAAIEDFNACLEITVREKMPEIYVVNILAYRGDALIKSGHYEEAVKDLSVAIAMYPQATYYYHRGLALQGLGKLKEAEEDFSKAGPGPKPMRWY